MAEHKNRLVASKMRGDIKGLVEVLMSLRVNALQISPELRKNLVYELIRNDIFLLHSNVRDKFFFDLLEIEQPAVMHAVLSLVSIIVSTLKGIQYIMTNGKATLERLIEILRHLLAQQKETTNPLANSVNLRFCIAIL